MTKRPTTSVPRLLTLALVTAFAAAQVACVARVPVDPGLQVIADETPLGGAALEQRKHDLTRAYDDLLHMHRTMQSLIDRKDRRSLSELDRFVDKYMEVHLAPLLTAEWQSSHPELMARDASLRFIKAEVLIQMRYPGRVQDVRNEIERRYQGQGDLLIEYPIGKQGTLSKALEILADRKWKG